MLSNSPVFEDFKNIIQRLEEVLAVPQNDISRDSAIKRFELCFDLAWKSIKLCAKQQGQECYSPRECFKTAFQLRLIDHDASWLKMIEDRNTTAHLYKEVYAEEVFTRLPSYLELFQKLYRELQQKIMS